MCDVYLVFSVAVHVITRLMLDEINRWISIWLNVDFIFLVNFMLGILFKFHF